MRSKESAHPGATNTGMGVGDLNSVGRAALHTDSQAHCSRFPDGLQGRLALRPKEAAAALGIGHNSIYELCNRADFPTVRIGHKLIIPVDGLRRWLDAQAKGGELL